MDIDELKRAWQSQAARIDNLEERNRELYRSVRSSHIDTQRSRLLSSYVMFIVVCLLLIPFVIVSFPYLVVDKWATVAYVCAMVILTIFNSYIYMLIRKVDLTRCSVKEALSRLLLLECRRRQLRYVSMTMAVMVLAVFFYELYDVDNLSGIIGGVIGGVLGGLLGLSKEAKIKRIIRSIKQDLQDIMQ